MQQSNSMIFFQDYDGPIAEAVKQSMLWHQWYLTESLVVLALFDKELEANVKGDMATTLLQTDRPAAFVPVKPSFPANPVQRNMPVHFKTLLDLSLGCCLIYSIWMASGLQPLLISGLRTSSTGI